VVARGKCLSGRNVLHPLSNSDLAHTRPLSYINSRCESLDRAGGTGHARCSASEVSDDFVYSAGGVASPYLLLSPSRMPPAAVR